MNFKDFRIDPQRSARDICRIKGPDSAYGSYVVQGCQQFSRLPLGSMSAEQLRLLLGQNYALEAVVPAALIMLYHNPFAQGDFYPGDLLERLMLVEPTFWKANPNLVHKALLVFDRVKSAVEDRERLLAARAQELETRSDNQDESLAVWSELSSVNDLMGIIKKLEALKGNLLP